MTGAKLPDASQAASRDTAATVATERPLEESMLIRVEHRLELRAVGPGSHLSTTL